MPETMNNENCNSTPEFLINQKTLDCLAVIKGNDANDAVIGMEKCNGSSRQQWFPCDGQWQWGGNRTLCLAPKGKGNVRLVPCDSASAIWNLDEEDRLVTGSVSLGVRVRKPSKPVKLWAQRGGNNKKWWTLSSMKRSLEDAQLAEHCFPPEVMAICHKEMGLDSSKLKKEKRKHRKEKREKREKKRDKIKKDKKKKENECLGEESECEIALSQDEATTEMSESETDISPDEAVTKHEECETDISHGEATTEKSECETSISHGEATTEVPEYLISQKDYKCLTVINGSTPKDAIIGVTPYTGCTNQQWFVSKGQWQWGGDRTICLHPDTENQRVKLVENQTSSALWNFNKSGIMTTDSYALEIPVEGEALHVRLNPQHGDLNQKWWTLSSLKPFVGTRLYPFPPKDRHIYKQEMMRGIVNKIAPLSEPLPYMRDISNYPGTVLPSMQRINSIVTLDLEILGQPDGLRMRAPPKDWQATNMYVVAGDLFTVILPESTTSQQASQIKVRVGAQTDHLNPSSGKISKGRKFKRMPLVSEAFDIHPGANILRSQYGGNLIFVFKEGENFTVNAEVHNVVEAPHYILHKTSDEDWQKMKAIDVPYSILEGKRVVVVAPTLAARKNPDPRVLLQRFDNVVSLIDDLSGFDETDPPPRGKHWLVDDIQISAGSAHAGFPIMFQRQVKSLPSPDRPHTWGVWHELGHNYQQPRFWSNAYGVETTVNLFSLYVDENINGSHRLKRNNSFIQTAKEVDNGLTFQDGKCNKKLVFLMEIQNAYPQQGWDMYRHLNKTTRALSQDEANKLTSSKQQQYDYVYKVLSQFIGVDLLPQYQRWKLKISEEAQQQIQDLGLPKCLDISVREKFE